MSTGHEYLIEIGSQHSEGSAKVFEHVKLWHICPSMSTTSTHHVRPLDSNIISSLEIGSIWSMSTPLYMTDLELFEILEGEKLVDGSRGSSRFQKVTKPAGLEYNRLYARGKASSRKVNPGAPKGGKQSKPESSPKAEPAPKGKSELKMPPSDDMPPLTDASDSENDGDDGWKSSKSSKVSTSRHAPTLHHSSDKYHHITRISIFFVISLFLSV